MKSSTTIKVSVETRDRIRSFGGGTYEETIVEALDVLEANRFWAEVDAAVEWQRSLSDAQRQARAAQMAALDAAFTGIE